MTDTVPGLTRMMPTAMEGILSPRSTTTRPRDQLTTEQLYDERRSLRREWIRFMGSLDSEDEENEDESSTYNRDDDASDGPYAVGDVPLCYPVLTDTNASDLDRIFSEYSDGVSDEDRDAREDVDDVGRTEDVADVVRTFRSLKEQVERLDGILEELGDLPNSPTAGASNCTTDGFRRGINLIGSDSDDNIENELNALEKLERELRDELLSVNIEMRNKSYGDECGVGKVENKSSGDECNVRKVGSTIDDTGHGEGGDYSKGESITNIDGSNQTEHSVPNMFLKYILDSEMQCVPRACAALIEEDKDDWDQIAYQVRYNRNQNMITSSMPKTNSNPLILERDPSIASDNCGGVPLRLCLVEDEISPLPSTESNTGKEPKQTRPAVDVISPSSPPSLPYEPSSYSTSYQYNASELILLHTAKLESEDDGERVCHRIESEKPRESNAPASYTIRVPPYSNSGDSKLASRPIQVIDNNDVLDNEEKKDDANHTNTKPISMSATKSNELRRIEGIEKFDDLQKEADHSVPTMLLVAPMSLSDSTLDENIKTSISADSHERMLKDILEEEEEDYELVQEPDTISETPNDNSKSAHGVLRHLLLEQDETDSSAASQTKTVSMHERERSCDAIDNESSNMEMPSIEETVPSEVTISAPSDETFVSCVEEPQPVSPSVSQSLPESNPNCRVETRKEESFLSPNLSFELDMMSDGSLDLMTISVESSHDDGDEDQTVASTSDNSTAKGKRSRELETEEAETPSVSTIASNGEKSIDRVIGRIYARTQVGGVLVLDQDLQASLTRIATRAVQRDPEQFRNFLIQNDGRVNGGEAVIGDGIEAILAENIPDDSFNGCCSPNAITDLLNDMCCHPAASSSLDQVKIVSGENDIEVVHFGEVTEKDISERMDEDAIDETISVESSQGSTIGTDKFCVKDECSDTTDDDIQSKLLSLNQQLIDSIASREFDDYSNLTTEDVSGIDLRGEFIEGRVSSWEATLPVPKLTAQQDVDRSKGPLLPRRYSLEESSVIHASPDVAIITYALVETTNGVSTMVSRETRVWKKTKEQRWKNCHFHRSLAQAILSRQKAPRLFLRSIQGDAGAFQ